MSIYTTVATTDAAILWHLKFNSRTLEFIKKTLQGYKCILGGGFASNLITNRGYGDLDFFFFSDEEVEKAYQEIETQHPFLECDKNSPYLIQTSRAYSFHMNGERVQFIRLIRESLEAILDSFDFENSKAALWWDTASSELKLSYSELLPELAKSNKLLFRRHSDQIFSSQDQKAQYAEMNFNRLEKYIGRFSWQTWDQESRLHLLSQYAWDISIMHDWNILNAPHWSTETDSYWYVWKLLQDPSTTPEELVLFYHLGGSFKSLLDDYMKDSCKKVNI